MRKILLTLLGVTAILIVCFTSCLKKPETYVYQDGELNLPSTPYNYFDVAGPEVNDLVTLGRVLFYDKHLSKNNTISCASCHIQEHAFGDNKAFSQGFENRRTSRNSMAIHNIGRLSSQIVLPSSTNLFWDGRSNDIKEMVLLPALNHIEMGMASTEQILEKVKGLTYYQPLFVNASIQEITVEDISDALAHFVASINTTDTKFDRVHVTSNPNPEKFTALEEYGESVFNGKYNCGSCHRVALSVYYQNNSRFANIGLDKISQDKGKMGVTGNEFDRGMFKVPGLRNVQFSAPYMHDGRFKTLSEVIDHYSHGIKHNPNLDWHFEENGHARKLNITDYDKKALIAFLHTLTDYDVLTHDCFSNPFANQ